MRRLLLLFTALLALCSCRQKDIEMGGESFAALDVVFDWTEAPEASPEGMTVYFFPLESGGQIWRFDIAGAVGGRVSLPPGRYSLLAYNNDLAGVRIQVGSAANDFRASIAAESHPIEPLFSGEVTSLAVSGSGEQTVKCYPRKVSTTYTVRILHLKGEARVISASLRLHGPARSLALLSGASGSESSAVSADFLSAIAPLEARFESFRPLQPLTLEVTLKTASRRQFTRTFDVTSQLANNPDPLNVLILIDTLELPDEAEPPASPDVGMDVGVDGWVETIIDYETDLKL